MPIRSLGEHTPLIHESAFISEFAYIVGRVEIGELTSVWPGSVIRADRGLIRLGCKTNLQDNSIVHADADAYIGNSVTIGHGVVCHAANVGDGSLIGNGSVLNNGVIVGEMCLVAAGSVILENLQIPSYSIVRGVPAKVIGTIRERHKTMLTLASQGYVDRIPLYRHLDSRSVCK